MSWFVLSLVLLFVGIMLMPAPPPTPEEELEDLEHEIKKAELRKKLKEVE